MASFVEYVLSLAKTLRIPVKEELLAFVMFIKRMNVSLQERRLKFCR